MMNPEIKAQWIAALRSGDYQQGRATLAKAYAEEGKIVTKYCCLGVLCDVLTRNNFPGLRLTDDPRPRIGIPLKWSYGVNDWKESSVLPKDLNFALGLNESNPRIPFNQEIWDDPRLDYVKSSDVPVKSYYVPSSIDLASLNDHGFSFTEIADLIETYL
jgi:hypothetical protein